LNDISTKEKSRKNRARSRNASHHLASTSLPLRFHSEQYRDNGHHLDRVAIQQRRLVLPGLNRAFGRARQPRVDSVVDRRDAKVRLPVFEITARIVTVPSTPAASSLADIPDQPSK
jgi:hypothetical protein